MVSRASSHEIRAIDHDLAIETTGAQQGRVKNVGTVGGSDNDDVGIRIKAIHLDEELVERLFALVMSATDTTEATSANRVDLVDKDDAGRFLPCLNKKVPDPCSPHADKHLDEI